MKLRQTLGWGLAAALLVGLGFAGGLFAGRQYGGLLESGLGDVIAGGAEAAHFYWSRRSDTYLEQGQELYNGHCGLCHGAHGNDGRAPNLTMAADDASPLELFRVVRRGVPGTEMPPFLSALNHRQTFQIVAHLQKLRSAPAAARIAGVPARGAALVRGKGNCLQCHILDGEGVAVGPSLSRVGRSRSAHYLRRKLERPEESMPEAYRLFEVIQQSGETIRGFRQNEDTFSIQVRDLEGRVHSFWKRDVVEVRQMENKSFMPSYQGVFSEAELDDVVAYLASLGA